MILFVVNEKSGNGRGKKIWAAVEEKLKATGTAYEKLATVSEADAVDRVRDIVQRGRLKAVAVIGGDGTLHGLLPIIAGTGIPYGLIPSGSGNDTSRTLGIPADPLRALDIILAGKTRAIDLLETTAEGGIEQRTLTAVAIGLDGAVAADVNGSRYKRWCNKLRIGSFAYIIGLFRALAMFKPRPITVTVDGIPHEFSQGWLSVIASGPSYGGGLRICPDARPDDGKLHVCVVHNCSVGRILLVFPTLLTGGHVKRTRYVTILSGSSATVRSEFPMLAFGDGEPSGVTPITAVVRPGQLDFLIAVSG
ncbi:diacylglycerol/lipid kinase family protein [Cohnella soli]|uniref:Diacylglycerol/lipid kinase family protein n=1 Tax=Cohnella soli TaxID=425005 RepID=A0ABW0I578_9BACL